VKAEIVGTITTLEAGDTLQLAEKRGESLELRSGKETPFTYYSVDLDATTSAFLSYSFS